MEITDAIKRKFDELCELPEKWDSYDAKRISLKVVLKATDLMRMLDMPEPSIVPCSDGGVQLEWHRDGFDIEICISEAS